MENTMKGATVNLIVHQWMRAKFQPRVSLILAALALGAFGNLVAAFVGLAEPFGLLLTIVLGNLILFHQSIRDAIRASVRSVRAQHARVASAPSE
jgi:hypothetical protein